MATLYEVFTNFANAIRSRTGKTATMTPDWMVTEIGKLSDTSNDTVTSEKMTSGTTAHDRNGELITGSNPYEKSATDTEVSEQETLLDQAIAALEGKAAGGGGSSEPDNQALYQRVEYIKSDGEAYILTDFVADNTCGAEMVVSFPSFADHTWMGSRNDSGDTRFFAPYAYSASIWYAGFNTNVKISASTNVETIYRCQANFLNSRLATVHDEAGTLKGSTAISATLTAQSYPIYILTQNYGGIPRTPRIFNLYSVRCSKGYDVVREYIPAYRKSDGVIGLYEKFTGQFLTNAGTGAFTKGADIDWEV